jgi:hypothetical protein
MTDLAESASAVLPDENIVTVSSAAFNAYLRDLVPLVLGGSEGQLGAK